MFDVNEITQSVSQIKLRKAPGHDCVRNEHIKYGGDKLAIAITQLFNSILKTGYIPLSWKTGIIIPLYKGHPKPKCDPDSYRAISLLPALYKLYEKVVNTRIQKWLTSENIKFPNSQQQGFQKNKGCINASFNIHATIYHNLEQGSKVYVAFADIQKAFDTVLHEGLIYLVQKLGIKGKILQTIISSYTNIKSFVKINGLNSEPFVIKRGVRQGGVLSSFLYLIYINDLLTCLENSKLGTYVCNTYSGNTALADDIALLALSPKHLQMMLNIVSQYANKWKFVINKTKTVIVIISKSCKTSNNVSF